MCAGLITQIGNAPLLWSRPRNFYLAVLNPVTLSSSPAPFNPLLWAPTQPAASHAVHRVHRPSDMNRGYNLLAFPHGGYLIREKKGRGGHERGQWTLWGPQRGEKRGERCSHERTVLQRHTDQKTETENEERLQHLEDDAKDSSLLIEPTSLWWSHCIRLWFICSIS